jgi:hypothetical protein
MIKVSDLLHANPLMLQDQQEQHRAIYRIAHFGRTHTENIYGQEQKISMRTRKIAYVSQAALTALRHGLLIATNLVMAQTAGQTYWTIAKIGAVIGGLTGIWSGLHSRALPFKDDLKYKSDIYACYQSRFKLLQPLQEIEQGLISAGLEMALFKFIPHYALINATVHSLAIGYNAGGVIGRSIQALDPITHTVNLNRHIMQKVNKILFDEIR